MTRLDDLPPDLRATLSLLVDRGKSYAQVAELLGIPESLVRDRAHAALDTLAGAGESPPVAGEHAAVTPRSSPAPAPAPPARAPGESPSRQASRPRGPAISGTPAALPVSRRGGALLLAGIVVVVVVVVVLLAGSGGSSSHKGGGSGANATATTPATTTGGTGTASGKTPKITKQLTLTPTEPGSKALGLVEVLAEGSQHAFFIAAEHLAPSKGFFYAVWLYNSPSDAKAISKSPPVGSNGRLQGGALLPSDAHEFHKILLTRETNEKPTQPGPVVLSGPFSLH